MFHMERRSRNTIIITITIIIIIIIIHKHLQCVGKIPSNMKHHGVHKDPQHTGCKVYGNIQCRSSRQLLFMCQSYS